MNTIVVQVYTSTSIGRSIIETSRTLACCIRSYIIRVFLTDVATYFTVWRVMTSRWYDCEWNSSSPFFSCQQQLIYFALHGLFPSLPIPFQNGEKFDLDVWSCQLFNIIIIIIIVTVLISPFQESNTFANAHNVRTCTRKKIFVKFKPNQIFSRQSRQPQQPQQSSLFLSFLFLQDCSLFMCCLRYQTPKDDINPWDPTSRGSAAIREFLLTSYFIHHSYPSLRREFAWFVVSELTKRSLHRLRESDDCYHWYLSVWNTVYIVSYRRTWTILQSQKWNKRQKYHKVWKLRWLRMRRYL